MIWISRKPRQRKVKKMLDFKTTAGILRGWDDILVICHENPDGDALGSMTGLVRGLRALGKRADWYCASPIPPKFTYLFEGLENTGLTPAHVMTVDVADSKLLGDAWDKYGDRIELAIDHHGTHVPFAENCWVEPKSAAAAEMVWLLLKELGAGSSAAGCLYTGMATDTGCFRYRNVTPRTLRAAAETLEAGADAGSINQRVFETRTRASLEAEKLVMGSLEFACDGKVALIQVPQSVFTRSGASENEVDGVESLPRQVEGVLAGVTVKEKPDGKIKISLRTNPPANAAAICQRFGGGGHQGAAGCSFEGVTMAEARLKMMDACEEYLKEIGSI